MYPVLEKKREINALIHAVVNGEAQRAVNLAEDLLSGGLSIEGLIHDGLTAALRSLNKKCTNEEFNLLEIMLAGRAMMAVMDNVVARYLPPASKAVHEPSKTIILGTIEGDIHDLGKHVVKMLLKADGYRVIDIGKDVRPADFVKTAIKEGAGYIGVSSLLTSTIPNIREIRKILDREGGGEIKVIAGGAAVQQTCTEDINVDHVANNAFDILQYLNNICIRV
jgi:methylmalonyl-CoA mutase cobalamin-binding domain/chain